MNPPDVVQDECEGWATAAIVTVVAYECGCGLKLLILIYGLLYTAF